MLLHNSYVGADVAHDLPNVSDPARPASDFTGATTRVQCSARAVQSANGLDDGTADKSSASPLASAQRETTTQVRTPRSRAARALRGAACSGPGGFSLPTFTSVDDACDRALSAAVSTAVALERGGLHVLHFDLEHARRSRGLRVAP